MAMMAQSESTDFEIIYIYDIYFYTCIYFHIYIDIDL